ncbi:hypothetical protein QQS21_008629 [Conoideocrella luteorostrata]|uniref:Uncharacterized protein n=1 Tax=Conoideocrella luteorostrata TaxID=1105319 RepID=A0AAJ0CIH8_9HYPO|nr:hypothetical protein QQS21_008629 [Conoideocrella luteorostrata]
MSSQTATGDVPLTSPSVATEVQRAMEQCKGEMTSDLHARSKRERFLIATTEDALKTLLNLSNQRRKRLEGVRADLPYFSFHVVYLDVSRPRQSVEFRLPGDVLRLSEDLQSLKGSVIDKILKFDQLYKFFDPISMPSFQDISKAAAISFLMLMKLHFDLDIADLFALLAVLIPFPDEHIFEASLLPDPSTDDWQSARIPGLQSLRYTSPSTKVMRFPGAYPAYRTEYMWMERHKLHGKPPKSASDVAMLGGWKNNRATWFSLIVFSDDLAADVYARQLNCLANTEDSQIVEQLESHWIEGCYYIYHMALNDACIWLAHAAETLDQLRYKNALSPTVGGALVCLMFMNHLEYNRRVVGFLSANIDSVPESWKVESTGWSRDIASRCQLLRADIGTIYDEASSLRSLTIEQHGLAQSRNVGFLTVLAAFFVPITAVSGFFGMNTTEINGSNWPTKYFGVIAGPLTIFSVLLPLIALRLLDAVLRFWPLVMRFYLGSNTVLLVSLAANIQLGIQNFWEQSKRAAQTHGNMQDSTMARKETRRGCHGTHSCNT